MKSYVAIVVAAAALASAGQARAQQGTQAGQEAPRLAIAVVDSDQLVQSSAAGKEAMVRLKKLQDQKITDRKKMTEELEGLQKQIETQRATLSDAKLADLQKQFEDKQIALRRYDDDAQQQLEEARRKELGDLEKRIMPVIQEIGREMKFQLVFNKFQSGLVFADESLDITDLVIKRFNTKVTH
jgi:outer membrane protein